MKRFFIALVAICTMSISMLHAQEMVKGKSFLNAGVGLFEGWGLNVSYDYGLIDTWGPGVFTIGGYIGFGSWGKLYPGLTDYRVSAVTIAPRATYRYSITDLIEVYGTAMLGPVFFSYSEHFKSDSKGLFVISAGGRYTFDSNIAVFVELAGGYNAISFLNGGLSFAF